MSSAETTPVRSTRQRDDALAFEVRWPATLNRWHDAHGLCNGATHQRVEMLARVTTLGRRATVEAMLQWSGGCRELLDARSHDCVVSRSTDMVHIDIPGPEQRLLAVTIDTRGQLLYAQTTLFQSVGLSSAVFDPPRLLHIACAASSDGSELISAAASR